MYGIGGEHDLSERELPHLRGWHETDSGMWEMRGEPRHHLSSKVLCWTALDRAVKLGPALGEHAKVEEWERSRDEIRDAVMERGGSEEKTAFAQSFDSETTRGSTPMGSRERRAHSRSVPSGSCRASPGPAKWTARRSSLTSSPATPTTSACSPRRSTPLTVSSWVTSPRRSATSG